MSRRGAVEPNWKPLENRLGTARCAGFMFMGRVNGINLYKHGISRGYLNLDDDGNCYVAGKPGCHLPADLDRELSKLEECLKGLGATLETSYGERFIEQKHEALRQHGVSLLTIQVEPDEVTID
ncbi:MAG TPA: hypothetical protein VE866_08125 [Candidatus Binatia bacterium]|nr:hypothetical protein [Candidatus Binatia bacterium]